MRSRTETLSEFLARGGKIKEVPYQPPAPTPNIVKANSYMPENRLLSLGEGELYFAEIKPSKSKKKKLIDIVDNFSLPKDVTDRLKKACKDE